MERSKEQISADTKSRRDDGCITAGETGGATRGQDAQSSIELRSEEMQDILSRPPHLLVRSGISVICAVILLLIAGSFFFQYPDIVTGEIVITTKNPPVWLIARANGKIKELNCLDKQAVKAGAILAVIENPAVTADVLSLKTFIGGFTGDCLNSRSRHCDREVRSGKQSRKMFDNRPDCFGLRPRNDVQNDSTLAFDTASLPPENLQLGNIQNVFSAFIKATTDYSNFLSLSATNKEKEALNTQITGHKTYTSNLRKQLELKQKELELANSAYEREKHLFEKGTISKAEMETAESAWLNARQSLQQIRTTIASDGIESAQLQESVSKLDIQYQREQNSLLSILKTAINELETAIENWEQTYVLTSPIDGTASFNAFWASNQFVNSGDKVLAVIPENPGKITGRIKSPESMSGKIKPGQRVNIKINGYPYMEFGSLQGEVKTVSLVPNESNYAIEVDLTNGLTTNTGQTLDFTGELAGQAEIITDDRSLFNRIFAPLKYLLKKYMQ